MAPFFRTRTSNLQSSALAICGQASQSTQPITRDNLAGKKSLESRPPRTVTLRAFAGDPLHSTSCLVPCGRLVLAARAVYYNRPHCRIPTAHRRAAFADGTQDTGTKRERGFG